MGRALQGDIDFVGATGVELVGDLVRGRRDRKTTQIGATQFARDLIGHLGHGEDDFI